MSSDKFAVKIENTIRIFQKPLKYVKAQKVTIYKAILLFFTFTTVQRNFLRHDLN